MLTFSCGLLRHVGVVTSDVTGSYWCHTRLVVEEGWVEVRGLRPDTGYDRIN